MIGEILQQELILPQKTRNIYLKRYCDPLEYIFITIYQFSENTNKNTDLWDLVYFVYPLIQRSNPYQHALYSSDVWVNSILTYFLEGKREGSNPKLTFSIKKQVSLILQIFKCLLSLKNKESVTNYFYHLKKRQISISLDSKTNPDKDWASKQLAPIVKIPCFFKIYTPIKSQIRSLSKCLC